MAIRKIARMGHPVLRGIAEPVEDPRDPEIQRLIQDMIETMIDADGAGLAAPQVYVPLRLVIFQAPPSRATGQLSEEESFDHTAPLTVLMNPIIEVLDETRSKGFEGCLSVPGLRGLVTRADHIRYHGIDQNGEPIERVARGFHARVVQHEVDHLCGTLYPQRMDDITELLFDSEVKHWLKQAAETAAEEAEEE
ncbi:MAG TPA: peptide deformylase [Alphaproteobacteria bacterium]|nr:peptide deformylase [Alphaproteobacteria bacterium]